jgi:class 3 adenylate cyclase
MTTTDNYLILFADLVGSTDVASEVTPSFYAETYVASFHWATSKAWDFIQTKDIYQQESFTATIDQIRVAGDEVLSFTKIDFSSTDSNIRRKCEDIVASAVSFAYMTKLYWLASPYNLRRMHGQQFPRDVAVGIHLGPAALVPDREKSNSQIASLHLNVAKRIEGLSRSGHESRIFASYDVAEMFKSWASRYDNRDHNERAPLTYTTFEDRLFVEPVKGLPKPIHVHELAWPTSGDDPLINLLTQMNLTVEEDDLETEKAARFFAEHYLKSESFFQYDTGALAVRCEIPNADTVEKYIAYWFDAVSGPTKLFFDECWLVLNSFLISCSFLRHKKVASADQKKYIAIANMLLKRLRELHKKKTVVKNVNNQFY